MGGKGPVQVLVDGKRVRTVNVGGIARLYTLLSYPQIKEALLELRLSPGVRGYAFTFGEKHGGTLVPPVSPLLLGAGTALRVSPPAGRSPAPAATARDPWSD